ncbi:hypothetical protein BB560_000979 [Smittium megazygosporum]|uniref:Nucleoside phosphorylase domain-containing protein n=1 Tax=Smittium megazygosporum TaxID=133381 RepID=A0A2T9ZIS6_9FUNG|nr:hypothetical protein BB560_000979 [Smittium megazygosporum]
MPIHEMKSANFPIDAEGRTYHVECKRGDIANRVITVGDPARARAMATKFEKTVFQHSSHRGFLIITGIYKKVPITIVSIGMGLSMMDFFVRETRAVVDGPMVIIRFGSCGSICSAVPGDIIVADSSYGIIRNYDHFTNPAKKSDPAYIITDKVAADARLTEKLETKLAESMGKEHIVKGSNGCADSFYSSQGRLGSDFVDENETLISELKEKHTDAVSLEMEAHMLYHLAATSIGPDNTPSIRATCALIVYADRSGDKFITPEQANSAVIHCTNAIFDTLVEEDLDEQALHPTAGSGSFDSSPYPSCIKGVYTEDVFYYSFIGCQLEYNVSKAIHPGVTLFSDKGKHGDIVLNGTYSFDTLAQKNKEVLLFFCKNEFWKKYKYFVKVDEDTFVNYSALIDVRYDIGCIWSGADNKYCTGMVYYYSATALKNACSNTAALDRYKKYDDVQITEWLTSQNSTNKYCSLRDHFIIHKQYRSKRLNVFFTPYIKCDS